MSRIWGIDARLLKSRLEPVQDAGFWPRALRVRTLAGRHGRRAFRAIWQHWRMRISAKADYAVRAAIELTVAPEGVHVKGDVIAKAQDIPLNFLENILGDLRNAGIVQSRRGHDGGYRLAKPPNTVTVADIVRAVDGPLASVRGERPEKSTYTGSAEPLQRVWIALRTNLREVVEHVTLAHIAAGKLPAKIERLAAEPESWTTR